MRVPLASRRLPSHIGISFSRRESNGASLDKLVKDKGPRCLFLVLGKSGHMNAYDVVRTLVSGVFSLAKVIILSILRLGRWCWDRVHVR